MTFEPTFAPNAPMTAPPHRPRLPPCRPPRTKTRPLPPMWPHHPSPTSPSFITSPPPPRPNGTTAPVDVMLEPCRWVMTTSVGRRLSNCPRLNLAWSRLDPVQPRPHPIGSPLPPIRPLAAVDGRESGKKNPHHSKFFSRCPQLGQFRFFRSFGLWALSPWFSFSKGLLC